MTLPSTLGIWSKGQLLAFSALDGPTRYEEDLVLRTTGDATALEIKRPREGGALVFDMAAPRETLLAGDHFSFAKDMWRGPVWINLNWLIARGLERYGHAAEAGTLRRRTLEEIEKHYLRHGTFFEFYDDRGECEPPELLRKGICDPDLSPFHQVLMDYGWSATLYLDMVMGIHGSPDAAGGTRASARRAALDRKGATHEERALYTC